jgi:hypothetical protein
LTEKDNIKIDVKVKDNEDRKWIQLAQNRVLWWVMECAKLNLLVVTPSLLGSTPSFGLGLLRVVTLTSVFSLPATELTDFERVPAVVCPAADFVGKPLDVTERNVHLCCYVHVASNGEMKSKCKDV